MSNEGTGKPDENAIEGLNGFRVEVMAVYGERAPPFINARFRLQYGCSKKKSPRRMEALFTPTGGGNKVVSPCIQAPPAGFEPTTY